MFQEDTKDLVFQLLRTWCRTWGQQQPQGGSAQGGTSGSTVLGTFWLRLTVFPGDSGGQGTVCRTLSGSICSAVIGRLLGPEGCSWNIISGSYLGLAGFSLALLNTLVRPSPSMEPAGQQI